MAVHLEEDTRAPQADAGWRRAIVVAHTGGTYKSGGDTRRPAKHEWKAAAEKLVARRPLPSHPTGATAHGSTSLPSRFQDGIFGRCLCRRKGERRYGSPVPVHNPFLDVSRSFQILSLRETEEDSPRSNRHRWETIPHSARRFPVLRRPRPPNGRSTTPTREQKPAPSPAGVGLAQLPWPGAPRPTRSHPFVHVPPSRARGARAVRLHSEGPAGGGGPAASLSMITLGLAGHVRGRFAGVQRLVGPAALGGHARQLGRLGHLLRMAG